MKKKVKFILGLVCFVIAFFCFNCVITNLSYAWSTNEIKIYDMEINDGVLNSIDLAFDVPSNLEPTLSWVGLQTKQFNHGNTEDEYGDLTNYGSVYKNNYTSTNSVLSDEEFCENWGIESFNREGFPCFGDYSTVRTTISDLNLKLNENKKVYAYLWTSYSNHFYPYTLIASFEIKDGEVIVSDLEGNQVEEAETIDRIEIQDANLSLKVGQKPIYTANIKDYQNEIDISEAFIALNRESFLSSNCDVNDEDGLVEDYIYFYEIGLQIKKGANYIFSEDTKVFINGVEKEIAYFYEDYIKISKEEEKITPEGYFSPSELNSEFDQKQKSELEKIILQAIKDGKVKYKEEGFEDIINDALENEIFVEFYVSETIRKSIAYHYIPEESITEIDRNVLDGQDMQGYCIVDILVYVNGDVGQISELSTPILVTIPIPNGISQLQEGYERIWKVIRYHDGNVDVLDANETENGISFMCDKFSEFAVVYEDIKIEKNVENEENGIETELEINNPKTGDNTIVFFTLIIISITLEVIISIYQKRKDIINR